MTHQLDKVVIGFVKIVKDLNLVIMVSLTLNIIASVLVMVGILSGLIMILKAMIGTQFPRPMDHTIIHTMD